MKTGPHGSSRDLPCGRPRLLHWFHAPPLPIRRAGWAPVCQHGGFTYSPSCRASSAGILRGGLETWTSQPIYISSQELTCQTVASPHSQRNPAGPSPGWPGRAYGRGLLGEPSSRMKSTHCSTSSSARRQARLSARGGLCPPGAAQDPGHREELVTPSASWLSSRRTGDSRAASAVRAQGGTPTPAEKHAETGRAAPAVGTG